MAGNFLTANIAGLESMQSNDQVYGYHYNRIISVLSGLNPLPVSIGTITVLVGGLNMPGPLVLTNNPGGVFMQGAGTALIVGGTTGTAIMNTANNAANISTTDLGVVTIRAGLALTAGDFTLAGNINGQTISTAANFTATLTVASTITFAAHLISTASGTPATSSLGANVTSATFTGNDTSGIITIVMSGGLAANTKIATCTFASTYGATAPKVRLIDESSGVGLAHVGFYRQAFSTGVSFDLASNQALVAGTYIVGYVVIG